MLFVNNDALYALIDRAKEHLWIILCVLFGLGILWNGWCLMTNSEAKLSLNITGNEPNFKVAYQIHKEVILNAPYFGVYQTNLNEAITPSRLSEVIVGIMFSDKPSLSQVVLRAEDGFDKVYRIGESVKTGIVIHAINPDSIVVMNNGKLERLTLPEHRLKFESPSSPLKLDE